MIFLIGFVIIVGLIVIADIKWIHSSHGGDILGILALMIEATLGMPQFVHDWRTKTTAGLRKELVGTWFFGDVFKTIYFIYKDAPWVFVMCGSHPDCCGSVDLWSNVDVQETKTMTPLRGNGAIF